jgi:hypothetical protein
MNPNGENIRPEPRIAADCRSVGALSATTVGREHSDYLGHPRIG